MITQSPKPQTTIAQIIQDINGSWEFRQYHERNQKKGIFNIVKCGFDEMISHLQCFNKNLHFENIVQISDFLKDGFKVWAYSQYKIFAWVSAWLQFSRKISLNQIIQQNSKEIEILQLLFPHKPKVFLRYQFFLMFTKMNRLKINWAQHQIQFLQQYINNIENSSINKPCKIKWRLISFQLFAERKCLKTPNQCRERWVNHLNPKVKKSDWTIEQDIKMFTAYQEVGSKWSHISKVLKSRTEHMVKNRFNSLKHKWSTSNHQTTAFNPTTVLKRLKNRLKSMKLAEENKEKSCKTQQNSINNEGANEKQTIKTCEAIQVKTQNLTLSLFDVCSWQAEQNKCLQQNEVIVKEQADCFEYYFESHQNKGRNMDESEELKWLDDLMEKRCHEELFQYM